MIENKKAESARAGAVSGDNHDNRAIYPYHTIRSNTFSTSHQLEEKCLQHMHSNGIPYEGPLNTNGVAHRFSVDSKHHKKDEWYIARLWEFKGFPYLRCHYGSWSTGEKFDFQSWEERDDALSHAERKERAEFFKEMERIADAERKKRQNEAAIEAASIWESASRTPASDAHTAYLKMKNVDPYLARFGKNPIGYESIILPLYDIHGNIRSLQFISVGHKGEVFKTFLSGGEKRGCYCIIGTLTNARTCIVAEGFATAASIHKADRRPVVIAFDCGNMAPVVAALRSKYPHLEIVISGDDDVDSAGNPGRTKAEAAGREYSCKVVFPKCDPTLKLANGKRPTDFNDLQCLSGIEEVRNQIQNFATEIKNQEEPQTKEHPTDKTDTIKESKNPVWEEPIEYKETLPPVLPLNPALLPDQLRKYAEDSADRMQCSIDFVGIPLLVVFSSIIGSGCVIRPKRYDSWNIVPNLWGGIIGPPSVLKSPALNDCMIPLGYLEKIADEQYRVQAREYEIQKMELELRKAALKEQLKQAIKDENESGIESTRAALLLLEQESTNLPRKRYKTNDSTIEKLAEILRDNPRGLLMYRDELTGYLAALDKSGREGDRSFYLEAWNGYSSSPVKCDRIGRGTIDCNPCVSILGGIQPSKLRGYLCDTINDVANDGFVQRFQLLVYPDVPKGAFQLVDRKPDEKSRADVLNIAKSLAETNFISLGAKLEENSPLPVFRFEPEAQDYFNDWYVAHMNRLRKSTEDDFFLQHLGKYPKLMPSLALIHSLITLASGIPSTGVGLDDVKKAAELCLYLESHANRIYSIVEQKSSVKGKLLLTKLRKGELQNGFTVRDVYRKGWSGLTSPGDAEDGCSDLVNRKYLKEEKTHSSPQGGATTIRYRMHPILLAKNKQQTDTTDET